MKKFAIIGVFAFAFAFAATFAFADEDKCGECDNDYGFCCPETKVINKNLGIGVNLVETKSYSGMNEIHGTGETTANIKTGSAIAGTSSINNVNVNEFSYTKPMWGEVLVVNKNAGAGVNLVSTKSYSGMNSISHTCETKATVSTGTANSQTQAVNVINSNVFKVK